MKVFLCKFIKRKQIFRGTELRFERNMVTIPESHDILKYHMILWINEVFYYNLLSYRICGPKEGPVGNQPSESDAAASI